LAENPVDEEAEALDAARRKLPSLQGCEYEAFRNRLGGYLARRGYSWEVAGSVIRRLWQEESKVQGPRSKVEPSE
jgi:regulatory protein